MCLELCSSIQEFDIKFRKEISTMIIGTQLKQNFMLLLLTCILIINYITCSTMERRTTEHDPRIGEDAVSNVKDDIISSSSSPLCSRDYTVDEQEAINHKKDDTIQELKEQIHYLEIKHKVEKKEFNCQSIALVRALYAKDSGTQECMTPERSPIQLNEETLIVGFINRIRELEGKVYQLKDEKDAIIYEKQAKVQVLQNNINSLQEIHQLEKEKLKGEIETKDSLIEEHICKERKYKEETEKLKGEIQTKDYVIEEYIGKEKKCKEEIENLKGKIQTKDSLIEEHISKERKYKEETDVITHENEAKIQALQNNIKSLQEDHQIVKESLEKENRDLQEQNKTLNEQVTEKEAELQRYLPQNKEGTWKKYSGGDVPEDGVVADEGIELYVCRAEVDGDVVPGWTWPSLKECHVFHNGKEHSKSPYEVLVPNSSFEWIGCHGDEIPPRAVPSGKTKEGEVLYVGRVKYVGYYYVGKVQPSLSGCYNLPPVNGDFTVHPNYEILVWK